MLIQQRQPYKEDRANLRDVTAAGSALSIDKIVSWC